MIEVALTRIVEREHLAEVILHLHEQSGTRSFTIVIGHFEAAEIRRKVMGHRSPRPMTHDLLREIIRDLGGELVAVAIDALKEGTFHAKLHVRVNGAVRHIDSRSSDAIALAVAAKVPILVEEDVIQEAWELMKRQPRRDL